MKKTFSISLCQSDEAIDADLAAMFAELKADGVFEKEGAANRSAANTDPCRALA